MALSRLGAAGGSTPTPSPQESDHERRMRESGEKYDAWVDNLANKIDAVENNLGSGGRGGNMNGGGGGGGGGGWGGGPNDPLPPPDSPSGKALPFLVAFVGLVQCYFIYNEYEVEMNMGTFEMAVGAGLGLWTLNTAYSLLSTPNLVSYGTALILCVVLALYGLKKAISSMWEVLPTGLTINAATIGYVCWTVIGAALPPGPDE
eukprot:jgi/Tetstr1/466809/TSEL_011279.t1